MASARADSVPTAWAKDSSSLLERGAVRGGGRHVSEMQLAEDVVRKIDRRILPLLFVTYNFNFMDKVILSSASVFGLREDTVSIAIDPALSTPERWFTLF